MGLSNVGVLQCLFARTTGDIFLEDGSVAIGPLDQGRTAHETDRSEVQATDSDRNHPLSTQLLRDAFEADRCILVRPPQNEGQFFGLAGGPLRSTWWVMTAMETIHSDTYDH